MCTTFHMNATFVFVFNMSVLNIIFEKNSTFFCLEYNISSVNLLSK